MKITTAVLAVLLSAPGLFAQVTCRPLASGGYVGPDESVVSAGGATLACKAQSTSPAVKPAPAPAPAAAPHDKPVVFLNGTGNVLTNYSRGWFGSVNANSHQHDQSIELSKDFATCPVAVSLRQDASDYTVVLNHEGNNHNYMQLADASGRVILTDTAHGLHQSVRDKSERFCQAILADWKGKQ